MSADRVKHPIEREADAPRRLALFPGAFRPPHQAHLSAIDELAARDDVDEVIVIVSGRARHVPGTTRVLPPSVGRDVLDIYLRRHTRVRVEVADTTAVDRAEAYVKRARGGDTFLLCVGEVDRSAGDMRFDFVEEAIARGIDARIIRARTSHLKVRATDLRHALALGDAGRSSFVNALPASLNDDERDRVWRLCQEGLCEIDAWAAAKLRAHLSDSRFYPDLVAPVSIEPLRAGTLDPVFRITMPERRLIGKYAGDTVDQGQGQDQGQTKDRDHDRDRNHDHDQDRGREIERPKPRRRIQVEVRSLTMLAHAANAGDETVAEVPAVVSFDKSTATSVLTEILPGAGTLDDSLASGDFNPHVAHVLGAWLGRLHTSNPHEKWLWGDAAADRAHWTGALTRSTQGAWTQALPMAVRAPLAGLADASQAAPGLYHLAFEPHHVLVSDNRVGVIDFTRACAFADPAYDLATMIAGYIHRALRDGRPPALAHAPIAELLAGYSTSRASRLDRIRTSAVRLAGAVLLRREASTPVAPGLDSRVIAAAAALLATEDGQSDIPFEWAR